jgi:hypothetical protein
MQLHRVEHRNPNNNNKAEGRRFYYPQQLRGQHDEEGYYGQYERYLLRAFQREQISAKRLASEVNQCLKNSHKLNNMTRTKDLTPLIKLAIKNRSPNNKIYICKDVNHYFTSLGDAGWGCGYRNFQMICSYLLENSYFTKQLFGGIDSICTVPEIQTWMEKCWSAGFDREGRKIFNGKLTNTKGMLGTTDVAALFRYFGIRMNLVDFLSTPLDKAIIEAQRQQLPFPKQIIYYEPNNKLFEWVYQYFSEGNEKQSSLSITKKSRPFRPPLYLQHPGHSRTIVGVTKNKKSGEIYLIVFDPAYNGRGIKADLKRGDLERTKLLLPVSSFTHEYHQIGYLYSKELLSPSEMEEAKEMDNLKR